MTVILIEVEPIVRGLVIWDFEWLGIQLRVGKTPDRNPRRGEPIRV